MKFSSVDFLMGNKWRRSGAKLYSSSTIFTFVPFPASPLWMLTYFRDMIDLKFRQHLLLHIWKIIRHYCIAEKKLMRTLQNKASQWFKIFNHFWCKNSNFLLEWILVFWTYFLKSSFHECLLKGWHWKKAERRASSNSWMQFQGLKCSRVGLLDVFWPP